MEQTEAYQGIERYLKDPAGEEDALWESGGPLFWVDWRDYDEWIIDMANEFLPEEDRIEYRTRDCALPRGGDILLKKDGVFAAIPYGPDRLDRDTTLRAVQARLDPAYQLRCFTHSMENDTLGFCLLSAARWKALEDAFGAGTVAQYFRPVGPDSRLFG